MPELPQPVLLVLLIAAVAVAAGLAVALVGARGRVREVGRQQAEHEAMRRKIDLLESQGNVLRRAANDYLRFLRGINAPIRVR